MRNKPEKVHFFLFCSIIQPKETQKKPKVMTLEERKEKLMNLFQEAIELRLCISKGQFADLVGVNRSTMSSAMNGFAECLTERLVSRAERAVHPELFAPSMENSGNSHDNVQKNFEAPGTEAPNGNVTEIVKTLTEELRQERESHERIMMALIEKIGQK